MKLRLPLLASLAGATMALGGCVDLLPEPMIPSALIALPADRAVAPSAPLQADVAVFVPESSRAFAGADIAVRSEQELTYLADVRWSDGGPQLMQGAVVNALTKAGGPGRAAPAQLGIDVDYEVRWRIIDLSAGRDTMPVRVAVEVSVLDAGTRRIVAQDKFSAEGTPADRAPRMRAAELAIIAQKVADQVADFVAKSVPAKPQ